MLAFSSLINSIVILANGVAGFDTLLSNRTFRNVSMIPCGPETCDDSCTIGNADLSLLAQAGNSTQKSQQNGSNLSTAGSRILKRIPIVNPTPEPTSTAYPKEMGFLDYSIDTEDYRSKTKLGRHMTMVLPKVFEPERYIRTLRTGTAWTWLPRGDRLVTAQFFPFPSVGHEAFGVKGLNGCTSVVIVSSLGVYIAHIYEANVFLLPIANNNWGHSDIRSFLGKTFDVLRDGTTGIPSIRKLVGTDQFPGPLNMIYNPSLIFISPFADSGDIPGPQASERFKYRPYLKSLATRLSGLFTRSAMLRNKVYGYTRSPAGVPNRGDVILEVAVLPATMSDPEHTIPDFVSGEWRLWLDENVLRDQKFDTRSPGVLSALSGLPLSPDTPTTSSGSSRTLPTLSPIPETGGSTDDDSSAETVEDPTLARGWVCYPFKCP